MSTFAVTNSDELLPAVNYLLSNLDTSNGQGNVVIPGNVLVANSTTGVVSQSGNSTVFGYLYQYVNLRYSNNATGTAGFDANSNNYSYFGVFNSVGSSPSNNPSSYQWYEVDPPFDTATSRTLYYSAIGGRQIQWAAASSPPSTTFQVTTANVAIDLDVVTTATGTPGDRGPIVMGYVITTGDPNPPTTSATLTGWFEASRTAPTPPIGTGLTPVVGDTAYFTYPATGASVTYEYNGSSWLSAVGQVVAGNVLVANTVSGNSLAPNTITGNKIANSTITGNLVLNGTLTGDKIQANTITANNIAASTITGQNIQGETITGDLIAANTITSDNIAANTITSNNIAANTITTTQIATNTITANNIAANTITTTQIATNTITANNIAANTITSNNIATGTLTTNLFTANTINANILTANTFTANSINGTSIVSGSITTDKLAANVLTANTVISTGATIGSFTSPGFWLQGNTGNARFGNTISIGNNLTVGNSAVIGTNLTVGANAVIGGNLSVTGLITSGSLDSNTVVTTTVVPGSISESAGAEFPTTSFVANAVSGTTYFISGPAVTATVSNQPVSVWSMANWKLRLQAIGSSATAFGQLTGTIRRWPTGSPGSSIPILSYSKSFTQSMPSTSLTYDIDINNAEFPPVYDIINAGSYTYGWAATVTYTFTSGNFSGQLFLAGQRATGLTSSSTILVQLLKR